MNTIAMGCLIVLYKYLHWTHLQPCLDWPWLLGGCSAQPVLAGCLAWPVLQGALGSNTWLAANKAGANGE